MKLPALALLVSLAACATPPQYAAVPPPGSDNPARDQIECEMMARSGAGSYASMAYYDQNAAFLQALAGPGAVVQAGMVNFFQRCLAARGWQFVQVGGFQ